MFLQVVAVGPIVVSSSAGASRRAPTTPDVQPIVGSRASRLKRLFVYVSICSVIDLFILFAYFFISLFIYIFMCIIVYASIYLFIRLNMYLIVRQCNCLFVYLFI